MRGEIEFEQGVLNGTDRDFSEVYKAIMKKSKGKITFQNAAREYLSKLGLTPHHYSSTIIQLIPTALHANIPHIGSASDMRGGQ